MSVERMKQLLAEMDAEAASHDPFQFQGMPMSSEELYAARNRTFSPFPGRWLEVVSEPVACVEGDNLYTFVDAPPRDEA